MLKKISCIVFVMFCFLVFATASWSLDLKDGEYEITTKMDMPGMAVPPMTITQCITQDDPVPNQSDSDQDCKIIDQKIQGNTVTWTMECDQPGGKVKSTGSMTYKGDSFEGTVNTSMGAAMGGMTVKTMMSGKRVGDCQ